MIILGPGVPPSTTPAPLPGSCISLPRYAQLIHANECAFYGVRKDGEGEGYGCDTIWSKWQRDDVAKYLAEAQQEIEQQVNFPLCRQWYTDEVHHWRSPLQTNWGKVLAPGVMAITAIAANEAVDYSTEPAVIGPIATTLTDTDEIAVFYPGSLSQIIPDTIQISGGFLTIWIPRCRLVAADKLYNPNEGWDYDDTANFTTTVDVSRVYNDPSVNATLVWPHQCSAVCATGGCSEYTHAGCMYVRLPEIGSVDVTPATYSAGAWTTSLSGSCCRGTPQLVRLNYMAGATLTYQMEDAILRLAHSKMPDEMCGNCETWSRLWKRDRHVPEILTRERLNCPYGSNEGAWIAWSFTRQFKLVRGFTM